MMFDYQMRSQNAPGMGKDESKLEQALSFFATELGTGATPAKEIEKKAAAAGIAERTLKRAKRELGVSSFWVGRESFWGLKTNGQ